MLSHNVLRCLLNSPSVAVSGLAATILEGNGTSFTYSVLAEDAMQESGEKIMNFEVGKNYFIETLTKYFVGTVIAATATEVKLSNAAWIANTGLFTEFMRDGNSQNLEVEIVGDWDLPIALITGKGIWKHRLFKEAIR